ncbi:hypothetical protein GCM10010124_32970 [Pilimelia terevasa]|uniref:FMN-binding domain-containing protein n=1 Tax=Pilimelia terevasa TaxID=53372 RepID=A0A8J3FK87_9ACTN|nr:FMN-binding protein [Pilimelia terevasa]GGK37581.1 hypothetical protein GCM10010124_32970 [Pilimelia terevasa]
MHRITAALFGTLAGTAVIVGLRLVPPEPPPAEVDPAGSASDDTGGAGTGGGADNATGGSRPGDPPPAPTVRPTPDIDKGNDGSGNGNDGGDGGDDDGGGSGVFPGKSVTDRYGAVRVTVTLARGRITEIATRHPDKGESGQINDRAVPLLKERTLVAQSAEVDTVSGATYTSRAYRKSLQSALDAAKPARR